MAKKQNKGFIKIYRSIEDNPIWKSEERFSRRDAWIDLLLMANHEQRTVIINGEEIIVNRGQRFTSLDNLANRWHWNDRKTVLRYLRLLEKLGMLTRCATHRGTLLTIVNYDKFQGGGTPDATPDAPSGALSDAPSGTTQTKNYISNYSNKNERQEEAGPPPDSFFFSGEY